MSGAFMALWPQDAPYGLAEFGRRPHK